MRNESSTWSTERLENGGLFTLNTIPEGALGLGDNALYGFDSVRLPSLTDDGEEVVVMDSQLVAGIATTDFYTGLLGLSPVSFNFTNSRDPVSSFVGSLVEQELLPSVSWGYTAGAAYRGALGSLTLGGFDESRLVRNEMVFGFGADISLDLTVAVQAVAFDGIGSNLLMVEGAYFLIDSVVAQIWLPVQVCEAFERAFGLVWDEEVELYLVDDEVH